MMNRKRPTWLTALALGIVHALVDGGCAFVLFRDLTGQIADLGTLAGWIVAYNVTAFALQAPLGWLVDRMRADRAHAVAGVGAVIAAIVLAPSSPEAAAVLAGFGNALFHVGAGAYVLASSAARATEVGLFVGPGAVGLTMGILIGRADLAARIPLAAGLALGAWATWALLPDSRESERLRERGTSLAAGSSALLALLLLLGTVALRSVLGDALSGAWRTRSLAVAIGIAVAASCGKMLGGVVGDRLGWMVTVFIGLLVATPLMTVALTSQLGAWAGALLVQITMPLTLKAVHGIFPRRPGWAFGLPSAALLVGAVPGMVKGVVTVSPGVLATGILASMIAVAAALALLHRRGVDVGPRVDPLLQRFGGGLAQSLS